MNKELTFTAFHRYGYLKQAIHSWNQNTNILDWPVSYLLEPTEPEIERRMTEEFQRLECAEISGVVNDHRLGVLKNPHAALTSAFAVGNDFVVLAEDDVIVSDDTLEYFEWAMKTYKEDTSVLAVLAYSRLNLEKWQIEAEAVSRTKVFCPLIWGTWADRWETLIKPNWDLDYSTGIEGQGAGWDWNMMRVAVKHGKDFLYPQASRSTHIGRYGGEHTTEHDFPQSQALSFRDFHHRDKDFKEVYLEDWKLNDYYPRTD